eukprot:CAMPEP_0201565900 /NCGR_PEP_ID=MMETSP0190_2-20130828/5320_1 /ASSEMBLY_ACC=CAM_ASM_000263 /TAXON_ID=37353 /ORGANISM="Rosalina sp." /LENGTH=360 /DNA_ID=CAMNT_0047983917 /DNA_START=221 /DNA_END=1303 /DNA_ORIENTATION=+
MNNNNYNNNSYMQQMPQQMNMNQNSYISQQQQAPQQYQSSAANMQRRAKKKATGRKLRSKETAQLPTSRMDQTVELDNDISEQDFLQSVQQAYGSNARVEINSNNNNSNNNRQQISYQVVWENNDEAQSAYAQNAQIQQKIAQNLNIKGSAMAFDKPAEPRSIDGITLQLDSDTSSILCGACLVYNNEDKCMKVVHYSDRNYAGCITHSGDTQVFGKSVHTIKLSLSDLDQNIKQLFFTLCACGPSDLSQFKEPVISLYENDEEEVNLIQYGIEQAGKARSVVMCRLFRANGSDWSIQALGSEEWHIQQKVCMAYHNAQGLIDAHLKVMKEAEDKKKNDNEDKGDEDVTEEGVDDKKTDQ